MIPRKALEWRCRRGTKELDYWMQGWLARGFDQSNSVEQALFVQMLEWPDDTLLRRLLGQEEPSDAATIHLIAKIRAMPLPQS